MQDVVTYVVEGKSFDTVDADLRAAAARHRVGILNTTDLHQKLQEKGFAFGFPCRVYDVCNPGMAAEVLSRDLSVGSVLPCRICLYEKQGQVYLSMVKPTALLAHFGWSDGDIARQVEQEMSALLDEAAA